MLKIENYQRLKNKVIGLTGYYVHDIKPVVMTNIKAPYESTHWYMIELTNRYQFLMVQLSRESKAGRNGIPEYELKLGQNYKCGLNKFQLRNMDIVVNSITNLILEQYVP